MIRKIIRALTEKDYIALSQCFSENCKYFDYCPSQNGEANYFVYGSDCVEMFFRNRFTFDYLDVAEPVFEDENTATYFGAYNGPFVYARLKIEEYDENGLAKKVLVTPA
jgi:hypothetical protein